jgi:hypothetical protein
LRGDSEAIDALRILRDDPGIVVEGTPEP